jgi:large subunit ribosomal protein L25
MAVTPTTSLAVATRPVEGSRATRRLRRRGLVPGIVYGGGIEPATFEVDARILRNTLANRGAVLDLQIDGEAAQPVMVKEVQRHPVRGDAMHVDLLRVDLSVKIQASVVLELTGAELAPGTVAGGVLSQDVREVTVEARPNDIPDTIQHDVSAMEINETLTVSQLVAPSGLTLMDDPEVVVASITPPTLEPVADEIETETEVIGEKKDDA